MVIRRVLVPYHNEEDKKKLEDYIEEKTGRRVDLGPIGYGGKLTLQTMDIDLMHISRTNITCAGAFPGLHFHNVDDFIEWHSSDYRTDDMAKYSDIKKGMIHSIPIIYDNPTKRDRLIGFLHEHGFEGEAGPGKCKAFYLDNEEKSFHEPHELVMNMLSSHKRNPLHVDEFIRYYDRIIVHPDFDFYYDLIATKYEDRIMETAREEKITATANEMKEALDETFKERGLEPLNDEYRTNIGVMVPVPLKDENAPEKDKPRITAGMLMDALDRECKRLGVEPIKRGNKTGSKVIVKLVFPKEAEADHNSNQKEAGEESKKVQWTASSSTKLLDKMLIERGLQPAIPVEKKGSGVIIPGNSSENKDE